MSNKKSYVFIQQVVVNNTRMDVYESTDSGGWFAVETSLLEQGEPFYDPYSGHFIDSTDDNLFDDPE